MRSDRKLLLLPAFVVAIVFAISVTTTARLQKVELTAEQRGRQIYLRGVNAAGQDIVATMGNPTVASGNTPAAEIPAAYLACVSCHGRDGAGKPEGGVRPSNRARAPK